jgi:hypothetical protein
MLHYKSPVQFPPHWQRNGMPSISQQFGQNVGIEEAVRYLDDELQTIAAEECVLFSNFDDITNAARRSKRGHSEGVGVRFKYQGSVCFMGCDKWANVAQNIYALHLSLRYMRSIADAGVATIDTQLRIFNVQDQSPSEKKMMNADILPEWMQFLGLGNTATLQDANAVYRARAKLVQHDEEALIALNSAIEQARQHLRD